MTEDGKAQADGPKSNRDVLACTLVASILFGNRFWKVLNEFSLSVLKLLLESPAIGKGTVPIAIVQVAD